LKRLDKRYRTRYDVSLIENLRHIRDRGMKEFLESEKGTWISEKGLLCVHDGRYYDPVCCRHGAGG
jgi:hypothetical protein